MVFAAPVGKGMGKKCYGKRRDWDTGIPERRFQGFVAGKSGRGKGESEHTKKYRHKTIVWRRRIQTVKSGLLSSPPKARIVIKKIPVEVTEFHSLGEKKNTN